MSQEPNREMNYRDLEIYRLLQELNNLMQDEMQERWHRSLPFPDALFDRWERARKLGFGEGVSIYQSSMVFGAVKVGHNTWIGPSTILDGSGGLEIGSFCSLSAGVQIYTHDSIKWSLSGGKCQYEYAPVKIGDRCYIGPNVVVSKGITIGDGVIIGANSFVNRDIPSGSKAWGNPARVIQGNVEDMLNEGHRDTIT